MTDETKALVEQAAEAIRRRAVETCDADESEQWFATQFAQAALVGTGVLECLETQAREIERLREALEAYAARCTICSGGGSIAEEDSITGAYLWRDCPGCTPARAALAGDSHDQ